MEKGFSVKRFLGKEYSGNQVTILERLFSVAFPEEKYTIPVPNFVLFLSLGFLYLYFCV